MELHPSPLINEGLGEEGVVGGGERGKSVSRDEKGPRAGSFHWNIRDYEVVWSVNDDLIPTS